MRSRRAAVTLIEVMIFAAMIGVGVAVSGSAGGQFGVLGYVDGFFVGTLGAFAAFFAFGSTAAFTIGLLTGVAAYPVCSNGKCHDRGPPDSDYRYEDLNGQLVARCKCGNAYAKKGRRVLQLQPDGSQSPYMIWKPSRGWFLDEV